MHTFLSNTWLIFYPVLSIKINRQIKIIRTVQCDYNAKKKKVLYLRRFGSRCKETARRSPDPQQSRSPTARSPFFCPTCRATLSAGSPEPEPDRCSRSPTSRDGACRCGEEKKRKEKAPRISVGQRKVVQRWQQVRFRCSARGGEQACCELERAR